MTFTKRHFLDTQSEQRRETRTKRDSWSVVGRRDWNPAPTTAAPHLVPRAGPRPSPVEGLHVAVLRRHGHAAQVGLVAHCLEIAAAEQKVYRPRAAPLRQRQGLIDLVQLAVAATGHSHAHPAGPKRGALPATS